MGSILRAKTRPFALGLGLELGLGYYPHCASLWVIYGPIEPSQAPHGPCNGHLGSKRL